MQKIFKEVIQPNQRRLLLVLSIILVFIFGGLMINQFFLKQNVSDNKIMSWFSTVDDSVETLSKIEALKSTEAFQLESPGGQADQLTQLLRDQGAMYMTIDLSTQTITYTQADGQDASVSF